MNHELRVAGAAELETVRLALEAMGTRFELVLPAAGRPLHELRAAGEAAFDQIREDDRRLSRFRPDAIVANLNRFAAARPVRVDAEFFDLLTLCRELHEATGGAFDPAVGAAMDRLVSEAHAEGSGAEQSTLPAGFSQVVLDAGALTVRFAVPGLVLDFGAIGKGFALDRAESVLREAGITSGFLHGGTSSILAIGAPPGADAWKALLAGTAPDAPPLAVIALRDQSLSVSAPHGRLFAASGGNRSHLIDPRSLVSVPPGSVAAVLHRSGAVAEAWSTALAVGVRLPVDERESGRKITALVRDDFGKIIVSGEYASSFRLVDGDDGAEPRPHESL